VVHFIRLVLDAVAPGTVLITETNVPHEENISYFGTVAQPEAQLVYQFPLAPLVLDAFATGNATALAAWADSLATPYTGTSFLNFLASHDGVGVRPAEGLVPDTRIRDLAAMSRRAGGGVGERTLADGTIVPYELNSTWFDLMAVGYGESEAISRHLSSHAVMFAMAGVPLIYVHSLFGSSNDAEGFATTGRPRSYNRERFTDLTRLMSRLGDGSGRAGRIFAGMREMATTRSRIAAFDPFAPQAILAAQPELLVVLRGEGSERALVVVNVSADTVEYRLSEGPWRSLLGPEPGSAGRIVLRPWEAAWLVALSQ
jgi:sucrose phosphorylase